jgi:malate synthase
MEDAATAEISRSQIWQWVHHLRISREQVLAMESEVVAELGDSTREAARLFTEVALAEDFVEFMTLPAYRLLP